MGDWTDLMLDGVVCEGCGTYLGDPVGYPRWCEGCEDIRAASGDAAVPQPLIPTEGQT